MKGFPFSKAAGTPFVPRVMPEMAKPWPSKVPLKAKSLPPMGVQAAEETSMLSPRATNFPV